jgi:hypothetical protein
MSTFGDNMNDAIKRRMKKLEDDGTKPKAPKPKMETMPTDHSSDSPAQVNGKY